jgi:hypothetical protein
MDTFTKRELNLEDQFRSYYENKDLQGLTSYICKEMLTRSSFIRRVIFNDCIDEYQHHLRSLMKVYRPLDFYLVWADTIKFLENNGIKVIC